MSLRILFSKEHLSEWREVLKEEGRKAVVWKMVLGAIWHLVTFRVAGQSKWGRRMSRCAQCPLFDRRLKRCRPRKGHSMGCGCYMPFAALFQKHGWGWENLDNFEDVCW